MKRIIFLIVAMAVLALCLPAQTLKVLTEDWAPFNYPDKGKPAGLAVEMVQTVLSVAGVQAEIQFQPWNRAYNSALAEPNVLLFTAGRTAEREGLFTWLFRIAPREIWLMALSERKEVNPADIDAAKAFRIGVGNLSDASTQELVQRGFVAGKNLDVVNSGDTDSANIQKLFLKRVDIIAGNPISLAWAARQQGLDFSKVKKLVLLSSSNAGYWAVLSKSTDPGLAAKLQNAAAKVEKSGAFEVILNKYGL